MPLFHFSGCPEENGVGDGICHNGNNVEHCGFDGGDCAGIDIETCKSNILLKSLS